jgi:hypothetical protein
VRGTVLAHIDATRDEHIISRDLFLKGNAHFGTGDYCKAVVEYEAAIQIHGPSTPYLSNLAAAWLKLEE